MSVEILKEDEQWQTIEGAVVTEQGGGQYTVTIPGIPGYVPGLTLLDRQVLRLYGRLVSRQVLGTSRQGEVLTVQVLVH